MPVKTPPKKQPNTSKKAKATADELRTKSVITPAAISNEGLPDGWRWVKMGDVCEKITNGSSAKQYDEEVGLPISRIETIWNSGIDYGRVKYVKEDDEEFVTKYALKNNDILFSHINSDIHLGKTAVYKKLPTKNLIHGINILLIRVNELISADFLNYQLKFLRARGKFISIAQKSVNQSSINQAKLKNVDLVLPPITDQHAIVSKIEELLSELDKGKQQLETAQQQLKIYRQAVLSAGTSGKLTGTNIGYINSITIGLPKVQNLRWTTLKLIDVAKLESGHTPRKDKPEYWKDGNIYWLSLQDIRAVDGKIVTDTKYKTNTLGIENSSARLLPVGTVCFCRDISVGYVAIMGKVMSTTQHFANWICTDKVNNKFLMYAFMASRDSLIRQGQGTTVKTIYMPDLKEMRIQLPSIEEQLSIVQEIESRLSVCDKVEETIATSLQQAETLRQSILKKAFEGRLI